MIKKIVLVFLASVPGYLFTQANWSGFNDSDAETYHDTRSGLEIDVGQVVQPFSFDQTNDFSEHSLAQAGNTNDQGLYTNPFDISEQNESVFQNDFYGDEQSDLFATAYRNDTPNYLDIIYDPYPENEAYDSGMSSKNQHDAIEWFSSVLGKKVAKKGITSTNAARDLSYNVDAQDTAMPVCTSKVCDLRNKVVPAETKVIRKKAPLGRTYNYITVDSCGVGGRWLVPISFYCNCIDKGYGPCGDDISLAGLIFERNSFTIKDIFLLSKLSYDGKLGLYLNNVPPIPQFGHVRDEQYLAYLANVKVGITAEQKECGASIGGFYRFSILEDKEVAGVIGVTLPIKCRQHCMDLKLVAENLFTHGFSEVVGVRENVIRAFFADFADLNSFFENAVLKPKKLTFEKSQTKTGIGDIGLLMLLDFAGYTDYLDGLQVGVNFVFPTSNKAKADNVWEIELGNGGGFDLEFFSSVIINGQNNWFNPAAYVGWNLGFPFTSTRRVRNLVVNEEKQFLAPDGEVDANYEGSISGLKVPVFTQYIAEPFEEYDTLVDAFADSKMSTEVKRGSQFFLGFGNYFYNAFNACLRFGIFYDLAMKERNRYYPKCNPCICPDECCECTEQAHRLSWNLTYRIDSLCSQENVVELSIGSQHVVWGKYVPRCHEVVASLVASF